MAWHATLRLDYRVEAGRSVARHRHQGPLRVLKSLYPEGDEVCHNVLVHPPGGLVGGDSIDIDIGVSSGAHGLVTTPGATRFYRSAGERALQQTHVRVASGARFEWLPLCSICTSGCIAENRLTLGPDAGAEAIGWEICALGLPGAGQPFVAGSHRQQVEVPGVWLERGRIDATDTRLMHGALGLDGRCCIASLFFVAGGALARGRRDAALEAARAVIDRHALRESAGATSPHPQMIVVRALAPLVEPATDLLRRVRALWRRELWRLDATEPRSWTT